MSFSMTKGEREAFLAAVHVGVLSVADPGRGPLTVPMWYSYEPGGDVIVLTGGTSQKARLIADAGRMSLCVQSETPPYRYVSVEGPVRIEPTSSLEELRKLAHRYLGQEKGDKYILSTAADREAEPNVLIRLRPERWRTVDYGKR
jgi:PPOX class probable F420-dependent enzyme